MPSERELTEALDLYNSLGPFDHCTEADMDRFLAARASLADAAAAERDPTPLTDAVLREYGFTRRWDGWFTRGTVDLVPGDGHFKFGACGTSWSGHCRTVGELKTLMRLAGIEPKGTCDER